MEERRDLRSPTDRGTIRPAGAGVPLRVVAGVFVREDTVLACRRAVGRSGAGRWEFPGGKIENGETPVQALRRELAEELAVSATIGALIDRSVTTTGSMIIDLACYRVERHVGSPVAGADHDQLRWQPIAALLALDWTPPDLPAVRALMAAATVDRSSAAGGGTAGGPARGG